MRQWQLAARVPAVGSGGGEPSWNRSSPRTNCFCAGTPAWGGSSLRRRAEAALARQLVRPRHAVYGFQLDSRCPGSGGRRIRDAASPAAGWTHSLVRLPLLESLAQGCPRSEPKRYPAIVSGLFDPFREYHTAATARARCCPPIMGSGGGTRKPAIHLHAPSGGDHTGCELVSFVGRDPCPAADALVGSSGFENAEFVDEERIRGGTRADPGVRPKLRLEQPAISNA